jgi:hypothetical protein
MCYLLQSPANSSLLCPNIFLSALFSNTFSIFSSFNVRDLVSHHYTTTSKIIVLHILSFIFLDSKLEGKRFWTGCFFQIISLNIGNILYFLFLYLPFRGPIRI